MPDEEFQKFRDFMLQSQAQAEVRLSKAEENMSSLISIVSNLATATLERFETLEGKVNILIDAQIKTEASLAEAQTNSEAKIAALADAQIKTEAALASLTGKMNLVAEAQAHTDKKLAELAEAQGHTDRRLDSLIDIVRKGRSGES
jgi:uncharacterized protein YgiM (DUF1202 family)